MENASKALIIAGAILLSILIISLGIMIYNQASGVVTNNSMTEVEVNTFNQKFEQYFGQHVRGANVNALISAVNSNNMSTDDESKKVTITSTATGLTISGSNNGTYSKSASTGKTYSVGVNTNDTSDGKKAGFTSGGLIASIIISDSQ